MASKESRKAYRIRKKISDGKKVSARDQAWYEKYEGQMGRGEAVPQATETVEPDPGPAPEPEAVPTADTDPPVAPEFQVDAEAPAPETPKVDAPRAEKSERKARSGGRWQDKYGGGALAYGREETCVKVATLWGEGLRRLNDSIRKNGATPLVSEEMLFTLGDGGKIKAGMVGAAMVLTVDKFMPSDFDMGPEVEAAIGTSLVVSQAWWVSRKAKKAGPPTGARSTTPPPPPAPPAGPPPIEDDGGAVDKPVNGAAIIPFDMRKLDDTVVF